MADQPSDPVEALFHQAADLPPLEQSALLQAACGNDAGLRSAVERLLAEDARLRAGGNAASGFLASPLARSPRPPSSEAVSNYPRDLPSRIGRYRILRVVGEGGMGTVYEAEQENPCRLVALKVIRPGLVSSAHIKRFTQEAQILGRLHHPGIAQIHEAGLAADGQPFLALEFIHGEPLDEHARRHVLDVPARLELMARVCDAVEHAHQHGVIHRDLKPSNIFVDESGQPKVFDFGVARAAAGERLSSAERTRTGQLVGTIAYMSPEQVSGDPTALDARSDVYALGVILFELLSGRAPCPLDNLPLPEAVRVIREQEPLRLGSVDHRFRGDLETILAKALEKGPERRYPSAAELAADIRRHLAHEPIQARPPSALYQLRKFARRHKALVGGTAGILMALVVGLLGTVRFAAREAEQRRQADQNARLANEEKAAALSEAYRARIAAASAALQTGDVADAGRQLEEAPTMLRDWEWQHLSSRLDDSVTAFAVPRAGAYLLTAATDGLRLAVIADRGVKLLDDRGQTVKTLPIFREGGPIHTVVQGPEGLLFLEGTAEKWARIRDEHGTVRLMISAPAGAVMSQMALSPDAKTLAVSWKESGRHHTRLYDSSGREKLRLPGPNSGFLWSMAFSPDSARLATTSEDGTARLWDAATGEPIGKPLRHPGAMKILCAAFRPDGARLATGSADGTVCQWDTATGKAVEPPYDRHVGEVWAVQYSPDGQWIASAGTDRAIRLWRAMGRQDALVLHGHTEGVNQLAFSRDGRRICSITSDGSVRIWEAQPNASLPVLRGHTLYVYPVAYSPDGRLIASGSWDSTVRLWDARTGESRAVLPHRGAVRDLAFGPDSSWLITACDGDASLHVWDTATGQRRYAIDGPGKRVQSLTIRPDGARVASVDLNGAYMISDVASGRALLSGQLGGTNKRKVLAYSPDNLWLAGTLADGSVALWDAQTNELHCSLIGNKPDIRALAFSADGRYLAVAGDDRIIRLWEAARGTCIAQLQGHTDDIFALAFHKGGTRLASAGRDRAVWLWDLVHNREVARLRGHTNYVWSLAFSPDGRTLISGSGDGTIRLWDTEPLRSRFQGRGEQ